jgi:hypothetical protein
MHPCYALSVVLKGKQILNWLVVSVYQMKHANLQECKQKPTDDEEKM